MSKLYFRYAAMNAGKSTALLQAAHNYEERGMRVRLFTAAHDDRAGQGASVGVIGSRLGLQRQVAAHQTQVAAAGADDLLGRAAAPRCWRPTCEAAR